MASTTNYRSFRVDGWHITAVETAWRQELQKRVLALAERQRAAKHPEVIALEGGEAGADTLLYLKIFHPPLGANSVKDLFRESKAARFLRQGIALSRADFHVPATIAVGERRSWRFLRRAFVLTRVVPGQPLSAYLHDCWTGRIPRLGFQEKKQATKSLARLIRRFHDLGFVHGDLVPSNIFVLARACGELEFCFMDNDRTRRYPRWLPQGLWKRNLVQLNRFPLPGVSLQDRVRFFRFYTNRQRRSAADDRLLRWLEARTRRRRKECDAVDATIDFRRLMRWEETSGNRN